MSSFNARSTRVRSAPLKSETLGARWLVVQIRGLFITTGGFTKDAEREAVRDGAPAIDLIDGIDLCILLKNLGLGVSTETVEVVKPTPEFFEGLLGRVF